MLKLVNQERQRKHFRKANLQMNNQRCNNQDGEAKQVLSLQKKKKQKVCKNFLGTHNQSDRHWT